MPEKSKCDALNDGPKGPSTENTQLSRNPLRAALSARKGYRPWTPEMVRTMQAHPDMTAAELAGLLGATPSAVRHARQRYGRFSTGADLMCASCGERPVWDGSRSAKRMRLCKGCYLDEMERRAAEARAYATARQHMRRWGAPGR